MTRLPTNCLILLVLCCLPALTGCVDQEKKQALADLQTTEELQASELQREQLKKQSASAREAAAKESNDLKARIAALEKELADKTAQIESLQQQMAQLQKKLDAALQPPATPAP
jgi:TolA-binding protein